MRDGSVLCACGCEQPVTFKMNGQPNTYLRGHNQRGSNHYAWRSDEDVSYNALHTYLRTYYVKTGICDECQKNTITDFALIHGRAYSRKRDDYRELCRYCHVMYDEIGGSRWRNVDTQSKLQPADAPSCKCGCGNAVTKNSRGIWLKFTVGHYTGAGRKIVQPRTHKKRR